MKNIAIAAALLVVPSAHADLLLRISDSVTVWNGGIAWTDGTNWYGQGWDRFPGVSPPWNPVTPEQSVAPAPAPVAVTVQQPRPVRQEPPPRRLEMGFNGEAVEISIRW